MLLISIAIWKLQSAAKSFLIELRVSDPFSRTTNDSCANDASGIFLRLERVVRHGDDDIRMQQRAR